MTFRHLKMLLVTAAAALPLLTTSLPAQAFCGFYVAKADGKLFNKASKVVVARKDKRTVVTMASDYSGDPKEFALVVPVPTVITKAQIHITDNKLIDHVDAYTAPRLVEYFDPDPCAIYDRMAKLSGMAVPAVAPAAMRERREAAKSLGVTIEAEYTVGEYDIVILAAKESDGLQTWLTQEGYKTPPAATPVLGSYIKQGMKFFVAKVNLKEKDKLGFQYLRPISVAYETEKFMLPVRLGTVNATGPQDMLVFMLTEKGRVEATNYRTRQIPSNLNVPIFTKDQFGAFYKAMFDTQVKTDGMKAVYTEYAWNMGWCDPCAADPIPNEKLVELGAFWLAFSAAGGQPQLNGRRPMPGGGAPVYVTRLHVRYDAQSFPEDIMFQETADTSNFQGRYVLNHPFKGDVSCGGAEAYQSRITARHEEEATNLARMTGWDIATIRQQMAAATPEKAWYEQMWGGKKP